MTQFLEPSWNTLSHQCLIEEAYFYIFNKFRGLAIGSIEMADTCTCCMSRTEIETKIIEKFLDKMGPEKRLYGSAQELLEQLKIYRNFPGNRELFNRGAETYQIPSNLYMSLKHEPYIYKPDLYAMLQNMAFYMAPPTKGREVEMMIVYYLKAQEEEINKFPEFVKFEQKMFDEWLVELQRGFYEESYSPKQLEEWEKKFAKIDLDGIIEDFKALVPYAWEHPERQEIFHKTFEYIWARFKNTSLRASVLSRRYSMANLLIYSLSMIVNRNAEIFFPNSVTDAMERRLTTCRVFEDDGRKFVMKWELGEALMEKGRGLLAAEEDGMIVSTMALNDARRMFETKSVEFIRYPIRRAKHRAVPIKTRGSKFVILAVDALFDILRELIHGVKMFQKLGVLESKNGWIDVFKRYEQFYFLPDVMDPYFVPLDTDQCVLNTARSLLGDDVIDDAPSLDVRDSDAAGFTAQMLRDELQYLGLVAIFPEIQNHADVVYADVVVEAAAAKNQKTLRTCDMYDAVEKCQLICIFERLPNYKKFLHNQQSCYRVPGLKCDECDPEKENQKTTTSSSGLQKAINCLKI